MLPTRRQFLAAGMVLSALPLPGCGAPLRDLRLVTLPAALEEMRTLAQASARKSSTAWSWSHTLAHVAQSIEYSMTGYPLQYSERFKYLVGRNAWRFFAWRGQIRHDLTEPIPGSPAVPEDGPVGEAIVRLTTACAQFMQWREPLQPHFAYGDLTHAEYVQAHAMHMANHFAAFQVAA